MKKPTLTTQFQVVTSMAVAIGSAAVGLIILLFMLHYWQSSITLNALDRYRLDLYMKFASCFTIAIFFCALGLFVFGIRRARSSRNVAWPPVGEPQRKLEGAEQTDGT